MTQNQKILQDLAVRSREYSKNKLKINSLNNLKDLDDESIINFQIECTRYMYNIITTKTKLKPEVVKMVIKEGKYSHCIVLKPYIVDSGIDYYIKTKNFVYHIPDYPIKIVNYEIVTGNFNKNSQF